MRAYNLQLRHNKQSKAPLLNGRRRACVSRPVSEGNTQTNNKHKYILLLQFFYYFFPLFSFSFYRARTFLQEDAGVGTIIGLLQVANAFR